jgi:hypothetical protein
MARMKRIVVMINGITVHNLKEEYKTRNERKKKKKNEVMQYLKTAELKQSLLQ